MFNTSLHGKGMLSQHGKSNLGWQSLLEKEIWKSWKCFYCQSDLLPKTILSL